MSTQTRIPPAVGVHLDAAQAEVLSARKALEAAQASLTGMVRVYLAAAGVPLDGVPLRVDRDPEGWFYAVGDAAAVPAASKAAS